MKTFRLSRGLCATVGEVLQGSHATLEALFISSGAPGDPPPLSRAAKWKEWLFRAGSDPNTNSLLILGNVLEEFMDKQPADSQTAAEWKIKRAGVVTALEENGLRYYRGGRVVPTGVEPDAIDVASASNTAAGPAVPRKIDDLLEVLLKGLRRSMHPLTHRRKGAEPLSFDTEYDVQDLLHALLKPWVADIRPEEFTPSYAGTSTRMDFLLPKYRTVIELKFVRDRNHGKKIGDELIVDIEHYRRHPECDSLWCVVFDQHHLLANAPGLKSDLEGIRTMPGGKVNVKKVLVLSA